MRSVVRRPDLGPFILAAGVAAAGVVVAVLLATWPAFA